MPRLDSYCPLIVVTLSLSLLLSGCVRSTGPDQRVRGVDDQVERQLLRDATLAFVRADYADAILLLGRFVRTHPHSSRSLEARWWLARSYQESRNLSSAAKHFRLLADVRTPNPYRAEALVRAAQIEDLMEKPTTGGPVNGILVSFDSLPMSDDPVSGIADKHTIKGATVLLDVPCGLDGKVLRNGQPLSLRAMDSVIRRLHSQGAAVYLGVTLRCLGHVADAQHGTPERWHDRDYTPSSELQTASTSGALRRSPYYSLRFGGYREFLVDWLSQLRSLPLTGLVFRSEAPSGMDEGFTPLALKAFEREFGVTFDPVRVLNDYGPISATSSDADVHLPDVFWKWAGWKARERLRTLRGLVDALRVHLPHLQFGLEVQSQSVVAPLRGLLHFAEDWADMARGPFDVFLTTIKDTSPALPRAASRGSAAGRDVAVGESEGWAGPVLRMVQSLGTAETVWTILPRRALQTPGLAQMLPEGVRRLYDYRAVP